MFVSPLIGSCDCCISNKDAVFSIGSDSVSVSTGLALWPPTCD